MAESVPRVWVPGGRGMLGQAVCAALDKAHVARVATGREVDIADAEAVAKFARAAAPSHIINCAAMTAVDACETARVEAFRVNALGPQTLARLAAQHHLPLAHVSTDYVFAGDARAPYREDAPQAPATVYGQSKQQGEQQLWAELGGRPNTFVVRTAWLFGHGGTHFVGTMQKLMQDRPRVQVVADQVGSPTYCDDLAWALCALFGLNGQPGAPAGTYHFANAGSTSWHGLASAVLAEGTGPQARYACEVVEAVTSAAFVRPAPRPAYSVLATDKVQAALGVPVRSWQAALLAYLAAEAAARRQGPCDGS